MKFSLLFGRLFRFTKSPSFLSILEEVGVSFFMVLIFGVFGLVGPAYASPPKFTDYPATSIWGGPNAIPNLSSDEAYRFRTRLRMAAALPANFAGHYRIAFWGCGSGCTKGAIIDLVTGAVTFLPFDISTLPSLDGSSLVPAKFEPESTLLMLDGQIGEESKSQEWFFWFDGSGLKPVSFTVDKPPSGDEHRDNEHQETSVQEGNRAAGPDTLSDSDRFVEDLAKTLGILLVVVAPLIIYFFPTIVANNRLHRNVAAIFVLNLFLGWTVLGWVLSLVWSFTNDVRSVPIRGDADQTQL